MSLKSSCPLFRPEEIWLLALCAPSKVEATARLLQTLCEQREPPRLSALFALAQRERMMPVLVWRCREPVGWPAVYLKELADGPAVWCAAAEQEPQAQQLLSFLRGVALQQLDDLLKRCGCPGIIYKGAAYEQTLYPHSGLRPMADIDLLVPKSRYREVEQLLCEQGYTLGHTSTNEQSFCDPKTGIWIDLHNDVSLLHEATIDLDGMFACATPRHTGSALRLLPVPEALLLHLFHMRSHGMEPGSIFLIHYLDLLYLWDLCDFDQLWALARRWRAQNLLALGLLCLEEFPFLGATPSHIQYFSHNGALVWLQSGLLRYLLATIRSVSPSSSIVSWLRGIWPGSDLVNPKDLSATASSRHDTTQPQMMSDELSRLFRFLLRLCSHDGPQDILRSQGHYWHRLFSNQQGGPG